ncbi:MAG TPA: PAS domain-containing hybrid sensor histidine kinase/response regulator [Hyphomicrobiaceae bacterium]|nr:PAS domain-containing hybrid sensor histidine kinase/response regulator [Hyphomicrobiaceae bacterium]
MIDSWVIVGVALLYLSGLFALAWIGDRTLRLADTQSGRPYIYALSLAVYCTSWTFFGSVGLAATTGYDFIPVYLGPILMFTLGHRLLLRVVRIAKSQNVTSVADFIAARYGKSQPLAAIVTVVAILGCLPYIALQLKAISISIETVLGADTLSAIKATPITFIETPLLITLALAAFAILFGTRHTDATEHQDGLMLAIAAESVVKLVAFLAVGLFVLFQVTGGPTEFLKRTEATPIITNTFGQGFNGGMWLTVTLLSFFAVLLLPRQFHVAVVENNSETEVRRAAWLFPLYLVLINLFVIPIAAAGMMTLQGVQDPDFFMLSLPISTDNKLLTLIAFVGGLSAATAMVIVESVALAIMVCNGLVVPLLLRQGNERSAHEHIAGSLLLIRRIAIAGLLLLGYIVYHTLGQSAGLAATGLISFAAIAQFAPAFFIGLIWRKGTARGAIGGVLAGTAIWAYTLVLPWFAKSGLLPMSIVHDGPFGISLLRPQMLFYLQFEPLTHGVLWSLSANVLTYLTVSLLRAPEPIERIQAQSFIQDDPPRMGASMPAFRLWRSNVTMMDLEQTVGRYVGTDRAARSFSEYISSRNLALARDAEADISAVRFSEHLLSSTIGSASARLVLSLLLKRSSMSSQSAMKLLDDATEALQYNRDLLQSALDQVRHGLSVFDKDMRLICWNRQFRELLELPPEIGRVGAPLDKILRVQAERGDFGPGDIDQLVESRLYRLAVRKETFQEKILSGRRHIEIRTSPMPQGGIVTTFSDITDRVAAANALARANETLERRVRERTAELLEVNAALAIAKSKADEANLDKTRFLAAASHDILQPLNAARLYATSLRERKLPVPEHQLATNVDASLLAVEEIFSALIEISRIDAGRMEPDISEFPLANIFAQLLVEFEPMAREKGLALKALPTSLCIRSDRRLLRRVLQNFVANAIKYTRTGTVLLGARPRGEFVEVQVLDTGPGIPEDKQKVIFKEFQRLEGPGSNVRGLGLGLSIVERICRILDHPIKLKSVPRRGSTFSITAPRAEARNMTAPEPPPQARPIGLAGTAVLCIDNEPAVLSGMEALLSGWGCTVRTAPSSQAALAALSQMRFEPDILLADYHLDSGTGVDAVLRLRKALGRAVPAIIITADHSLEVQREVKSHELSMLRKPLKAAALRAILNQISIRRQTAAE